MKTWRTISRAALFCSLTAILFAVSQTASAIGTVLYAEDFASTTNVYDIQSSSNVVFTTTPTGVATQYTHLVSCTANYPQVIDGGALKFVGSKDSAYEGLLFADLSEVVDEDTKTRFNWFGNSAISNEIINAGGMRVSFDIAWADADNSNCYVQWAFGTDDNGANDDKRYNDSDVDFGIRMQGNRLIVAKTGTEDAAIYYSSAAADNTFVSGYIQFNINSFEAGSYIGYSINMNDEEIDSGFFTLDTAADFRWDMTGYQWGFSSGLNEWIDNLEVSAYGESAESIILYLDGSDTDLNQNVSDTVNFRSDLEIGDSVGALFSTLGGFPTDAYYWFIDGEGDTDNALFDVGGGGYTNIVVNSDFSTGYTNNQTFSVRVYGESYNGNPGTNVFQLRLIEAALETELAGTTVYSGQSIGDMVGEFSSSVLGESITNVTYSLISGDGDADNVLFDVDGSSLIINEDLLDVTNGQLISVRIQSVGDGKTNETVFALTGYQDVDLDGLDDDEWTLSWIDDFSADSAMDYTYSRVESYTGSVDPTNSVIDGVLKIEGQQDSKAMTVYAAQQLEIGQAAFLELKEIPTASGARLGMVVCATNSIRVGGGREDMIYLSSDANKSRWLAENFVGTNEAVSAISFSDWDVVKSVYIQRTDVGEFTLGYVDSALVLNPLTSFCSTVFSNRCYIGIWHEAYYEESYQVDNLRIASVFSDYEMAFEGGAFISGDLLGTVVGTLSAIENGAAADSTYSLVSGEGDADNDKFQIMGDELQVGSYDFTGTATTNGQTFSVRINGASNAADGGSSNIVVKLTVTKDDTLDGLSDDDWSVVTQDDFSTDTSGDYSYSRVVDYGGSDPTILVTNGVLNLEGQQNVKSMTMHSSMQLGVGQAVFLDLLDIPAANGSRLGIAVCATNAIATNGGRSNMVYLATDAYSSKHRWLPENFVGSTEAVTPVSFYDWDQVKSVYVKRSAADTFVLGYVGFDLSMNEIATLSNATMGDNCFVGVWHESYYSQDFQVDNLRIADDENYTAPVTESPVVDAVIGDGLISLFWPATAGSFTVLTNADLVNGSWGDAGLVPVLEGDNYVVDAVVGDESSLFYKLESN